MFEFGHLPPSVIRHVNGLWRRRWVVVATAWMAALAGWFIVWLIPDKYESQAQVYVQTETILQPVLNGVTARPDFASRVEVMRLQLLARPNVEEIIYRAGLDKTIAARSAIERKAKMEGLVDWVAGSIRIRSPRDMYFVISYEHSNPEIAKKVTEAALNLLIEQDIGANLSENAAARRRLDLQIEEYEERLSANERAVAKFRRDHAVELGAAEGTSRRRDQKESELSRTAEEMAKTRGRILTLQNLMSATPRDSSAGELEKLRADLATLRSQYQDSHPDIVAVEARIRQLESQGSAFAQNPEFVRLRSELRIAQDSVKTLQTREENLRKELDDLDIALSQAPAVLADLQQIERQYDTTKKTYEELLSRRDRLQLTESLGPGGRGVEYQIFEEPERAINPSSPARAILIYAVIIAALGAGVAAALALNLLDKSYTQADELKKAFGLPVLGSFSAAPSPDARLKLRREIMRLAGAGACLLIVALAYVYLSVGRLPSDIQEQARAAAVTGGGQPWV